MPGQSRMSFDINSETAADGPVSAATCERRYELRTIGIFSAGYREDQT